MTLLTLSDSVGMTKIERWQPFPPPESWLHYNPSEHVRRPVRLPSEISHPHQKHVQETNVTKIVDHDNDDMLP